MGWKENQATRYQKLRNNPILWQARLKQDREKYRLRGGHKKFPSTCIVCGKKWLGSAKKRSYCSQKCVSTGVHNGRWSGGKYINKKGYVLIWNPTSRNRYELEHRALMEIKIGRKLVKGEDVHHINGIKHDNRIENLKLLSSSEHTKHHWKKWKESGIGPVVERLKNTCRLKRTSRA